MHSVPVLAFLLSKVAAQRAPTENEESPYTPIRVAIAVIALVSKNI